MWPKNNVATPSAADYSCPCVKTEVHSFPRTAHIGTFSRWVPKKSYGQETDVSTFSNCIKLAQSLEALSHSDFYHVCDVAEAKALDAAVVPEVLRVTWQLQWHRRDKRFSREKVIRFDIREYNSVEFWSAVMYECSPFRTFICDSTNCYIEKI